MSKYTDLKQVTNDNDFVGDKFTDVCSETVVTSSGTVIIQGLPSCPECGRTLTHRFIDEVWHCSGCGTEWSKYSLVEALQNERARINKMKEETDSG